MSEFDDDGEDLPSDLDAARTGALLIGGLMLVMGLVTVFVAVWGWMRS